MTVLHVERLGGLPAIGTPRSHLKSCGEIALSALSPADRAALDDLFRKPPHAAASAVRDAFRYRISRDGASGAETIEVPEAAVPAAIAACVKDTFV
jgi:emfourin